MDPVESIEFLGAHITSWDGKPFNSSAHSTGLILSIIHDSHHRKAAHTLLMSPVDTTALRSKFLESFTSFTKEALQQHHVLNTSVFFHASFSHICGLTVLMPTLHQHDDLHCAHDHSRLPTMLLMNHSAEVLVVGNIKSSTHVNQWLKRKAMVDHLPHAYFSPPSNWRCNSFKILSAENIWV